MVAEFQQTLNLKVGEKNISNLQWKRGRRRNRRRIEKEMFVEFEYVNIFGKFFYFLL